MEKLKKDSHWFTHDSNATSDQKIIALIAHYGYEGYGRWWRILELLRDQAGYHYDITPKFAYASLADALKMKTPDAVQFIDNCVNEFNLLKRDDNYIWSDSLIERMSRWDKKKNILAERGRLGAEAANAAKQEKKKAPPIPDTKLQPIITYSKEYNKLMNAYMADSSYTDRERDSYKKLIDWIHDNAKRVLAMKEPLTINQYLKLCETHKTKQDFEIVKTTLTNMHNYKRLEDRVSVNLTLQNWLRNSKKGDNEGGQSFAASIIES